MPRKLEDKHPDSGRERRQRVSLSTEKEELLESKSNGSIPIFNKSIKKEYDSQDCLEQPQSITKISTRVSISDKCPDTPSLCCPGTPIQEKTGINDESIIKFLELSRVTDYHQSNKPSVNVPPCLGSLNKVKSVPEFDLLQLKHITNELEFLRNRITELESGTTKPINITQKTKQEGEEVPSQHEEEYYSNKSSGKKNEASKHYIKKTLYTEKNIDKVFKVEKVDKVDKVEKVDNWFPEIGELPNAKHDNRELLRIGATIYEVLALFRHKKCSTYPRIRVLESDLYVTINSHSVHYRHGADKYHLHIEFDGEIYFGNWRGDIHGYRHGFGFLQCHNKYMYEGEWLNHLKEGNGIIYYMDGGCDEGVWREGKMIMMIKHCETKSMRKEYSKDKSKDSYRYKEKNKVREEGNIKKSENHRSNHTKEEVCKKHRQRVREESAPEANEKKSVVQLFQSSQSNEGTERNIIIPEGKKKHMRLAVPKSPEKIHFHKFK